MKRLIKLSMCFLLMLGVSGIQEVCAEEPTTYTSDAQENEEKTLVVSEDEITLNVNEVAYYYHGTSEDDLMPDKSRDFTVGLKDSQGNVVFDDSLIDIKTDDWNIVMTGRLFGNSLFDFNKDYEYDYTEDDLKFQEYLNEWKKGTDSKYIGSSNYAELLDYITEISGIQWGGIGWAGDCSLALIPIHTGTTFVTFSYKDQEKRVKVNVTNLSDEPTEALPKGLEDEFYSDVNEKVNVNLSKADTVSSDIFASALESGKEVTFNILGENNRTQYAWTFNGATITNPDIDLNLSLVFTSDLKDKIENLVTDKNILYLTFAHHGELPGIAKMKVDVSSQYKNGEEIYLYYYNEETGKAEQTGDKVIVKDGYAEFEISHCSTYFFTSKLIETGGKVEPTTPNTDNNVKSNETTDVKAKAEVKKDNNAIKDTGLDTATTTQGIAISMLILTSLGFMITMKRKKA